MTGLELVLAVLLALVSVLAGVAVFYAYKFGVVILRIEDAIEESLDLLDQRYESISKVLEIPLFQDSPEIRRVHEDIKKSRDSILEIANIMTNGMIEEVED